MAAVARAIDLADVDRLVPPLHPSRLDLGQVQGLVDERRQAVALLDDDAEVVGHLAHRAVDPCVARGDGGEDDLGQPFRGELRESDHRGERRPQLVADAGQEPALGLCGGLRDRPGVDERGRPFGDTRLEGAALDRELRIQPRVVHPAGDQAADRVQQRAVAGQDVTSGQAVVDGEDPDRPTLGDERRPEERGDPQQRGEGAVTLVRILVDVAEQQRSVGGRQPDQLRCAVVE